MTQNNYEDMEYPFTNCSKYVNVHEASVLNTREDTLQGSIRVRSGDGRSCISKFNKAVARFWVVVTCPHCVHVLLIDKRHDTMTDRFCGSECTCAYHHAKFESVGHPPKLQILV
jgi:uncharacterized protein (DUF2225 family)